MCKGGGGGGGWCCLLLVVVHTFLCVFLQEGCVGIQRVASKLVCIYARKSVPLGMLKAKVSLFLSFQVVTMWPLLMIKGAAPQNETSYFKYPVGR